MAAKQVETCSVATEPWAPDTLVYVDTLVPGGGEAVPLAALALEAAGDVGAAAVGADARPGGALVQVPAVPVRGTQGVALGTKAVEAALGERRHHDEDAVSCQEQGADRVPPLLFLQLWLQSLY